MKTKNCILMTFVISFFEIAIAQTIATTGDNVARPTILNSSCILTSPVGTDFPPPAAYNANSATVQLGVNNTGTDICQIFNTNSTPLYCQAMAWDKVLTVTPASGSTPLTFTSRVFLAWKYNNLEGSFQFPVQFGGNGGFDPDVAVHSNSTGTYIQIVFENITTGSIDGYSFKWDTATSTFSLNPQYKTIFRNDLTKRAKNPNIAVPKSGNGIAVVWHEEGPGPNQTLTITYNTTPPINYSNTVSLLQSKVYIYCEDKTANTFLGSSTGTNNTIKGNEVFPSNPPNQLFNRYFNPDVSYSEDRVYPNISNNLQRGISVTFVSEWFNPALFRIETGQLSVVQGTTDEFRVSSFTNILTSTRVFTAEYVGKPRIAARLSNGTDNLSKDFAVVMGNSVISPIPCTSGNTTLSKLRIWWYQTGNLLAPCPVSGNNLLLGTPYETTTSINPVVSCINNKGHYNVVFSTNTINGFDIVANTYKEGVSLFTPDQFSLVNKGACESSTTVGNQVIPSVASVKATVSPSSGDAHTNYLFWDQNSKTLNYKKVTNALSPGNGVSLRLAQSDEKTEFKAYPNPTANEVTFNYQLVENEKANEIEIFNLMGQSIDKISISHDSNEQNANVTKFPSGTYIAILKTNATTYKLEFIKK